MQFMNITDLYVNLDCMSSLQKLDLSGSNFVGLPTCNNNLLTCRNFVAWPQAVVPMQCPRMNTQRRRIRDNEGGEDNEGWLAEVHEDEDSAFCYFFFPGVKVESCCLFLPLCFCWRFVCSLIFERRKEENKEMQSWLKVVIKFAFVSSFGGKISFYEK